MQSTLWLQNQVTIDSEILFTVYEVYKKKQVNNGSSTNFNL